MSYEKYQLVEEYTPSKQFVTKSKDNGYRPMMTASERRIRSAIQDAERMSEVRAKRGRPACVFNEATGTHDNLVSGKYGPLVLKVRKGKRSSESHFCADCHAFRTRHWRYQDSNYGVVYLCPADYPQLPTYYKI